MIKYDIWLVTSRHQIKIQIGATDKLKAEFDFIVFKLIS